MKIGIADFTTEDITVIIDWPESSGEKESGFAAVQRVLNALGRIDAEEPQSLQMSGGFENGGVPFVEQFGSAKKTAASEIELQESGAKIGRFIEQKPFGGPFEKIADSGEDFGRRFTRDEGFGFAIRLCQLPILGEAFLDFAERFGADSHTIGNLVAKIGNFGASEFGQR